VLGWELGTYR
jgi:predicted HAD superfamily phosphohydrolase